MKKPEIILRLLKAPLDFAAVFTAFLLAYSWRAKPELIPWFPLENPLLIPYENYLWFSLQAAALVVLIFALERLYSLRKSFRFRKELRRMLLLTGAAFTIIILYFFIVRIAFFSRFILGVAFGLSLLLMVLHRLLLRLIQHALWKRGFWKRRILLIGEGKIYEELKNLWQHALGIEIIGRLAAEKRSVPLGDPKILGTYEELEHVVSGYDIDEVVQASRIAETEKIVEFCQLNAVEYRYVPDILEVQRTNTEFDVVKNIPIITLRSSAIDGWARVVKRSTDVVGASLGFILLSPVLLLVALGIKLDDGGPIFYKSRRISRQKSFLMWKFRSMVVNADHMKGALIEQNRRVGPLFKIQDDPRITRFGRFLRRTSLDELPQLWNVVRGDLSLVGPRAHLPEEVAMYEKHHRKVLAVKAGVTGLAQISGRSKLDFEEEVKLDIYYLENWSFGMDMKILVQTFGVLFEGE